MALASAHIGKVIPGYSGKYRVTEDGKVWSSISCKFLKPHIHRQGYERVRLYTNGYVFRWHLVHRLVAEAYVGGDQKLQVNHINGIKSDNRADNLEWVTASENIAHSFKVLGNAGGFSGKTGRRHHLSKPVALHFADGTSIIFPCTMEAQRTLGFCNTGISLAARGKFKQLHGYRWDYV